MILCARLVRGCYHESAMSRPKKDVPPSRSDINVRPCGFADRPNVKFIVTGPQPGRRRWRRFFETRAKADAYAHLRRVELANVGAEGVAMSADERTMARECAAMLAPHGKTIRDATTFFLIHLRSAARSVPVVQLVKEVQASKAKDGAGKRHLGDLKSRLAVFERDFEGRLVSDVTTADLDDWLRGLLVGPVGRNNFRKVVRGAFSYAVARGYCSANPVTATARAKVTDKPPGILSVADATALLAHADVAVLPYLAIGLFAGLRRAELERLDWREVDLAGGHIEVKAAKSKTARRRHVVIEPNLREWLQPLTLPAGPVAPNNLRRRLAAVRGVAGVAAWPENCLRHSFGSYHVAHFRSAAKTALEMGHVNEAMLFSNYREVVKPKEAARYWNIHPAAVPANVVPMLAATA